jgi:hypothetical protein
MTDFASAEMPCSKGASALVKTVTTSRCVRLQISEFQFLIDGVSGPDLAAMPIDDDLVLADGTTGDWVVVHTGTHWGPVEVCVSRLNAEPPLQPDWDEVVELSVTSPAGIRIRELEGEPRLTLTDRGGDYRLRISARGRAAGRGRYQSGRSAKLIEHYLIEAWPAALTAPAVLRASQVEKAETPHLEYENAGRAAAERIYRDLRARGSARTRSGRTGTAYVDSQFTGTRPKLFRQFADLTWMTGGGSPGELAVGNGYTCRGGGNEGEWDFEPILGGGEVRCDYVEFISPRVIVTTWNWHLSTTPFLASPAILRIELTQGSNDRIQASTVVAVTHSGLPSEWVSDMADYWRWKLEQGEKVYRLGRS